MRRISRLEVKNFKSLVDFGMDLPKFGCLIGLNGAGKSTVLQFIDFLSQLVRGDLKGWLTERRWKSTELKSKLVKKKTITFCVFFCDEKGNPAGRWEGTYSPSELRCTSERIDMLDTILQVSGDEIELINLQPSPKSLEDWRGALRFEYEGSILSALKEEILPESVLDCKRLFQSVESLETLTPERLRQRTREANGSLGHGGRKLSAFVFELGPLGRKELSATLKEAYPRLGHVYAKSLKSGWKQLKTTELFGETKMWTEASHLNDGMLRMIAILAELQTDHRFLLFDEIENGINPELVEFIINTLVEAEQQILVTTHSPMILNYLDDDVASKGVIYLYKTDKGFTESIPFFSIPSLKEKLKVMGPGEAFVDTNLTELADEIVGMTKEAV